MRDKLIGLLGQHGFKHAEDETSEKMLEKCVYFSVPEKRVSSRYGHFYVADELPDYYYEIAYEILLQWPMFRMRSVRVKESVVHEGGANLKVKLLYRGMILTAQTTFTQEALEAQEKHEAPSFLRILVETFLHQKMKNTRDLTPNIYYFRDDKDENPPKRQEVVIGEADSDGGRSA